MELVRCDLCGKEVRKKRGNKVNMCSECTQKLVKKVEENRKRTDGEDGRQQDNE